MTAGFVIVFGTFALLVTPLTLAVALSRETLVRRLRAALPYVTRVGGGLLVLAGAYAAYYGWYEVRVLRGDRVEDPIIDAAIGWQSDISRTIADLGVNRLLGALTVLALVAGLLGRRARRHRSREHPEVKDGRLPTLRALTTAGCPCQKPLGDDICHHPAVQRVITRTGRRPRVVTADQGYGEKKIDDALHDLGIRNVVIPPKGAWTAPKEPGSGPDKGSWHTTWSRSQLWPDSRALKRAATTLGCARRLPRSSLRAVFQVEVAIEVLPR